MDSVEGKKGYYDQAYSRHREAEWNQAPGKDVFIQALASRLATGSLGSNERLIDLGCGTGFLLERIRREVCGTWRLVGVDFAGTAILSGKTTYPHLELHCGDAAETTFPPSSFSIVLSYGTLEHMDGPVEGIRETARLLRPAGLFLAMIPTLGVYRADRADEGWYEDLTRQPQWNLKRETWEGYFSEHGLCLWGPDEARKFGAVKPGVFYFGQKTA